MQSDVKSIYLKNFRRFYKNENYLDEKIVKFGNFNGGMKMKIRLKNERLISSHPNLIMF